MKKMRTIITMLLVLTLAFSQMCVFADETAVTDSAAQSTSFSDITAGTKTEEAVVKLVAHNIISGYPDGTFRPDGEITRAEFAAVIARFKGIGENLAADAKTGFADLDNDEQNAWARPYVKAAADVKIINGFDDGTFRASEPVTYEQAVKMIVCAVGYEVVAQSEYNKLQAASSPGLTWSSGYIAAAQKNNITVGAMTANITLPATRGIVAILTSNAIDVPELKVNDNGTYEKVDESEKNENIREIKGIVSGTYYSGIDVANPGIGLHEIMIGTGSDKETYELSEKLRETIDLEDLLGKYVVAYYDNFDRQITTVVPRNNTQKIIDESQITEIDGDTVKYYNENGKPDSVSLSGYTKIYNGKYYPSADLSTLFRNGKIELTEGGGQKFAKITSYDVFVVNSKTFNSNEEKIYFKYNKTYKGEVFYSFPAASASKPEIYYNGTKKELSSSLFQEWTVVNLLESPSGAEGNKINRMYITSGKKSGKVTEGLDEERKVILDNKELYLTKDYSECSDKASFELNQTYEYYLDYTGQIAAVNKKSTATVSNYVLGYLVAADDEQVRLIDKNGTDTVLTMKKNVKIDGNNTDRRDVEAALKDIAQLIAPGQSGCQQPVKYYASGSELIGIDTVADSNGDKATKIGSNSEDSFVYNAMKDSVKATTSNITIDGTLYSFSSSTKVFYVPDDKTATGDYSVMSPSTAFATSPTCKIEVYGADPDERTKTATMVVMYGTDPAYTFTGKTPLMVVSKIISGGDVIEGYSEGSTTARQLTISEDKFKVPASGCVDSSEIGKGDIIRYIENGGEVIAIEMVYDASEENLLGKDGTKMEFDSYTSNVGEVHVKYAEAFDILDGENKITATTNMGKGFTDAQKQEPGKLLTYKTSSSTAVYRIDSNELVADNALENINTTQENPGKIIIVTRSSASSSEPTAQSIYIVK